jgi:hypothetical protein
MRFSSDIDLDVADRNLLLSVIDVTSASIRKDADVRKHNTGVYPTDIPYDPIHQVSALDYTRAENRGYIKLDLLNVWVYKYVTDEQHLKKLMQEPDWSRLMDREYFSKIIHIANHYDTMLSMPEPIDSISRMAMFLSIIRPGKKHLIGMSWKEVSESVWTKETDGYVFKRSHSVAYAHLVVVHLNLLDECYRKTGSYDLGQLSQ